MGRTGATAGSTLRTAWRDGGALTGCALGWAVRFYGRHLLMVLGLSLAGAVQRFVTIAHGERLPPGGAAAGELLTGAARILLAWLVLRAMVREEPGLAAVPARARWERLGDAIDRRRAAFVFQFGVLGAAFAMFELLPAAAIRLWVPAADHELATAVVVAVKNPTVIALTILWLAGVGRCLAVGELARRDRTETDPSRRPGEP
jgi:hypothetical protein